MENKELVIDDVTYTFRKGNFIESSNKWMESVSLFGSALSMKGGADGKSSFSINFGLFAEKIASSEGQKIRSFIMKYTEAEVDGKRTLLREETNMAAHFDSRRSHYFSVLYEGWKYHFFPFLPAGLELPENMNLSEVVTALMS